MKRISALMILMVVPWLRSFGAIFEWGQVEDRQVTYVTLPSGSEVSGLSIEGSIWNGMGPYSYFGVCFGYDKTGGALRGLDVAQPNDITLSSRSYWVLAYAEDVVDDNYMKSSALVFDGIEGVGIDNGYGEDIGMVNGDSIYLAFMAPLISDTSVSYDYDAKLYGWVELNASDNEVHVIGSAFSDSPVVVGAGAVPEPSGGTLLALGMGLLALRRKRKA